MRFLLIVLALGIVSVNAWTMGEAPPMGLQIVTQNVSAVSVNSFTVTFQTNVAVSGQIRFGTNYDFVNYRKLSSAQLILDEKKNHEIKVEGLAPQTSYRYQIILRDPKTGQKTESDFYLVTTL